MYFLELKLGSEWITFLRRQLAAALYEVNYFKLLRTIITFKLRKQAMV